MKLALELCLLIWFRVASTSVQLPQLAAFTNTLQEPLTLSELEVLLARLKAGKHFYVGPSLGVLLGREGIDHWPGFSWAITKIWLMVCLFVRGKIVPKRNIQQTQQKDRSSLEQADCWKSVCLTCGMCPIAVWFFGRRWRLWIYHYLITFTYFILPFVRLLVFFIA